MFKEFRAFISFRLIRFACKISNKPIKDIIDELPNYSFDMHDWSHDMELDINSKEYIYADYLIDRWEHEVATTHAALWFLKGSISAERYEEIADEYRTYIKFNNSVNRYKEYFKLDKGEN